MSRIGAYGGAAMLVAMLNAHKISYAWKSDSSAFAGYNDPLDPRINIVQHFVSGATIAGVGVDYDTAMTSDYGQWRVLA